MARKRRTLARYSEEDLEDQFSENWKVLAKRQDAVEADIDRLDRDSSVSSCTAAADSLFAFGGALGNLKALLDIREWPSAREKQQITESLTQRSNMEQAAAEKIVNVCARIKPKTKAEYAAEDQELRAAETKLRKARKK